MRLRRLLTTILTIAVLFSVQGISFANKQEEVQAEEGKTILFSKEALQNNEFINEIDIFISKPGNSLTIYGNNIDKNYLYERLLKKYNVPIIRNEEETNEYVSKSEIKKKQKEKPILNSMLSPDGKPVTIVDNQKSVTTDITLYNFEGTYYLLDSRRNINKEYKVKEHIKNEEILESISNGNTRKEIEKYKHDIKEKLHEKIQKKGEVSALGIPASYLTTIRVSFGWHDDNVGYDYDTYTLGYYTTDYFISDANEAPNTGWTSYVVQADAQIEVADNSHIFNGGYQGGLNIYWSGDYVLTGAPDTTNVKQKLDSGSTMQFELGYPGSINFAFQWTANDADLVATYDKNQGYYYAAVLGRTWYQSYQVAFPGDLYHVDYASLNRITGTDLGLWVGNHFLFFWENDPYTWKWISSWDTIFYDKSN